MVSGRAVAAWGASSLVVLAALAAVLIKELGGGWGWWVAAAAVVMAWAAGAGWVAWRTHRSAGVRLGAGSVCVSHIGGSVRTETLIEGWRGSLPAGVPTAGGEDGGGDVLGEGALRADTIKGDVSTCTTLRAVPSPPATLPAELGPPGPR